MCLPVAKQLGRARAAGRGGVSPLKNQNPARPKRKAGRGREKRYPPRMGDGEAGGQRQPGESQAGRNTPSVTWTTPFDVTTSACVTAVARPFSSVMMILSPASRAVSSPPARVSITASP